jgi:hypothetical protein
LAGRGQELHGFDLFVNLVFHHYHWHGSIYAWASITSERRHGRFNNPDSVLGSQHERDVV